MASKKSIVSYRLRLPLAVVDFINDGLMNGEFSARELLGDDVEKGISVLNVQTGVGNDEDSFSGWNFFFDTKGRFTVDPVQPGTCKGRKKKFVWNAEKKKFI